MNFEKTKKEMQDIISEISKYLGDEIDIKKLNFKFDDKGHDNPSAKKGCMYIYSFWHDDFKEPLKIGKAGPKTLPRYRRNHYLPNSSKSNLARSLITDSVTSKKYKLNEENVSEWMHENLYRINIEMPFDIEQKFDSFTLELIESILHYKYRPVFEGKSSQR